jgi:hypothetical protein
VTNIPVVINGREYFTNEIYHQTMVCLCVDKQHNLLVKGWLELHESDAVHYQSAWCCSNYAQNPTCTASFSCTNHCSDFDSSHSDLDSQLTMATFSPTSLKLTRYRKNIFQNVFLILVANKSLMVQVDICMSEDNSRSSRLPFVLSPSFVVMHFSAFVHSH